MVISHTANDFGLGYYIHQLSGMSTLFEGREALRVDVRALTVCLRVHHIDESAFELFFHPTDVHSMRAVKVPHGRISSCLHNSNHSLVVFMEGTRDLFATSQHLPKIQRGDSFPKDSGVSRDDFSLRGRMAN